MKKKGSIHYQKLDTIRVISCIAVFLYHLNILKGGFLAVCIFFTLSGYLSCMSALKKEKFSIKEYYLSRIKKIYIPLLVTVLLTIATLTIYNPTNWLNLKPETTSVLFGYNNFWQLKANLDYFARHINSPMMHMWYIAILLQFELIFPIIFIIFKKISNKKRKYLPAIITLILSIISYSLFHYEMLNHNIMIAYYHTLTRIFSCLLGMFYAYVSYNSKKTFTKKIKLNNLLFYFDLTILIVLFFLTKATSKYLEIIMLLTSVITLKLIYHGINSQKNDENTMDKLIKGISIISYEIYLIQYPVIYIMQNMKLEQSLKIPLTITITVLCSYILYLSLNVKKDKIKIPRFILCIPISFISIYGFYQYMIAKDYTKEMKELEKKITKNQQLIQEKQKEYEQKIKEEQEQWQIELDEFNIEEEELKKKITNLPIVGIGDSVMLGASNALYQVFPNGYFDGKVNRTEIEAIDILNDLKNRNLLTDILIFNLGTNGECASNCKKRIMDAVGNRQVFWVNATYPDFDTCNPNIEKAAEEYSNIHIVDWVSVVKQHPEYVASDKVHVGGYGAKIYSETIYNTIYQYYLQELNHKKEEKIKEHEKMKQETITFIGNDLLLNTYEYLQTDLPTSEFIIKSNFNYQILKEEIEKKLQDNSLTNYLILMFDKTLSLTKEEYQTIIELCENRNIYIITTEKIPIQEKENVHITNLQDTLTKHKEYLSPDKVHLSDEGNIFVTNTIKELIK